MSRVFAWIAPARIHRHGQRWARWAGLRRRLESTLNTIDVVAKALKSEENEQEMVKRERLAIVEIRALLDEMID